MAQSGAKQPHFLFLLFVGAHSAFPSGFPLLSLSYNIAKKVNKARKTEEWVVVFSFLFFSRRRFDVLFYDSFSDHSLPLATTAATERRNGSPPTPKKGCKMGQFSRHKGRNYNSVVSSTPFVLLKTGWVGGGAERGKKGLPFLLPPLLYPPASCNFILSPGIAGGG